MSKTTELDGPLNPSPSVQTHSVDRGHTLGAGGPQTTASSAPLWQLQF